MSRSAIPTVKSSVSPVVTAFLYPVGRHIVLPSFFGQINISGLEQVPKQGPLLIAPTHRSRWDGLVVGYALGRPMTGRDLRFMVSANEMQGAQGWLIRQFGGFPVDTDRAAVTALRHGIELLQAGEALVIFPEGDVMRDRTVQSLKPGLVRLALQAQKTLASTRHQPVPVQIIPVSLNYEQPIPQRGCNLLVNIGAPLSVVDYWHAPRKTAAAHLTADLTSALNQLIDTQHHSAPPSAPVVHSVLSSSN